MKDFDYFLKMGGVRKISPDLNRAKFLIKDMKQRIKESLIKGLTPRMIFESIYDSLRDFCDALLFTKGFKSYSHEASISFLKRFGFEHSTMDELDFFRYRRNGSKYYGKEINEKDCQRIKKFYEKSKTKIYEIIKKEGLEK